MYILGLHFGHDASVCILRDGEILVCLERERTSRIRHAIGLTPEDLTQALRAAHCDPEQIDFCAVTTTQNIEYIFPEPAELSIRLDPETAAATPEFWARGLTGEDIKKRGFKRVLDLVAAKAVHPYVKRLSPNLAQANPTHTLGGVEDFFQAPEWLVGGKLGQSANLVLKNPLSRFMAQSMQYPIQLIFKGKKVKGWMLSHHFAHAAYSFYSSNFGEAAVLTQDGSLPRGGYWGGMCYLGSGSHLYPIFPHYLSVGKLYEGISQLLGFGLEEGPGKMMGLAPYGSPRFFDPRFVGNTYDVADTQVSPETLGQEGAPFWTPDSYDHMLNKWVRHCLSSAKNAGYDLSKLGRQDEILAPINVDIAASTQKLLEETLVKTVQTMAEIYRDRNLDFGGNLCVSGGTALNCPANSRIFNSGIFKKIFIPPAVHDGGLSMGAALAIYHNTLEGGPRFSYGSTVKLAYLGISHPTREVQEALERFSSRIVITEPPSIPRRVAQRLAKNEVVALMHGRSEVGPRALGHRSILAHPGFELNWRRVNDIKKREYWRPFAPAVLEEELYRWFSGIPAQSPFMLLTARVESDKIPAVTHVDRSARVQTVGKDSPTLREILLEFKALTGLPILMNTSFNGPGQPIIETAEQALTFFSQSKLDALFIDSYEIAKKSLPCEHPSAT